MNAKLMSALVGIVVLATLCSAVPVEDSKQLDQFLDGVEGSTCLPNKLAPNEGTYYNYCFDVCYNKNGVKVCYKKCGYSATAPTDAVEESKDLDQFLGKLKGSTCFSEDNKPTQKENSYYDYCFDVCYNKNGVNVCYKKCGYSANGKTAGTQFSAKCKMIHICVPLPKGGQACGWNCV